MNTNDGSAIADSAATSLGSAPANAASDGIVATQTAPHHHQQPLLVGQILSFSDHQTNKTVHVKIVPPLPPDMNEPFGQPTALRTTSSTTTMTSSAPSSGTPLPENQLVFNVNSTKIVIKKMPTTPAGTSNNSTSNASSIDSGSMRKAAMESARRALDAMPIIIPMAHDDSTAMLVEQQRLPSSSGNNTMLHDSHDVVPMDLEPSASTSTSSSTVSVPNADAAADADDADHDAAVAEIMSATAAIGSGRTSTPKCAREFKALQKTFSASQVLSNMVQSGESGTLRKVRKETTPVPSGGRRKTGDGRSRSRSRHRSPAAAMLHGDASMLSDRQSNSSTPIQHEASATTSSNSTDTPNPLTTTANANTTPSTTSAAADKSRRNMRSQNAEFTAKQQLFRMGLQRDAQRGSADSTSSGEARGSDPEDNSTSAISYQPNASVTGEDAAADVQAPAAEHATASASADGGGGGELRLRPESDPYCWLCHKPGASVPCLDCPRSRHANGDQCSHARLIPTTGWRCAECTAEQDARRMPRVAKYSQDELGPMLRFAIKRCQQIVGNKAFPFAPLSQAVPVPAQLAPSSADTDTSVEQQPPQPQKPQPIIMRPMSFAVLRNNVDVHRYTTTGAFTADMKWFMHNCLVAGYKTNSRQVAIVRQILKTCKQEMYDIETCPECYYNANTHLENWFVEVCGQRPHILLWAKLKGFPYWPAKAMGLNAAASAVDVRFFGEHDRAWVPIKDCFLFSEKDPNPPTKKLRMNSIADCLKEVDVYIANITQRFGSFVYAPLRCTYEPEREDEQLEMLIPNIRQQLAAQRARSPRSDLTYRIVKTANNSMSIIKSTADSSTSSATMGASLAHKTSSADGLDQAAASSSSSSSAAYAAQLANEAHMQPWISLQPIEFEEGGAVTKSTTNLEEPSMNSNSSISNTDISDNKSSSGCAETDGKAGIKSGGRRKRVRRLSEDLGSMTVADKLVIKRIREAVSDQLIAEPWQPKKINRASSLQAIDADDMSNSLKKADSRDPIRSAEDVADKQPAPAAATSGSSSENTTDVAAENTTRAVHISDASPNEMLPLNTSDSSTAPDSRDAAPAVVRNSASAATSPNRNLDAPPMPSTMLAICVVKSEPATEPDNCSISSRSSVNTMLNVQLAPIQIKVEPQSEEFDNGMRRDKDDVQMQMHPSSARSSAGCDSATISATISALPANSGPLTLQSAVVTEHIDGGQHQLQPQQQQQQQQLLQHHLRGNITVKDLSELKNPVIAGARRVGQSLLRCIPKKDKAARKYITTPRGRPPGPRSSKFNMPGLAQIALTQKQQLQMHHQQMRSVTAAPNMVYIPYANGQPYQRGGARGQTIASDLPGLAGLSTALPKEQRVAAGAAVSSANAAATCPVTQAVFSFPANTSNANNAASAAVQMPQQSQPQSLANKSSPPPLTSVSMGPTLVQMQPFGGAAVQQHQQPLPKQTQQQQPQQQPISHASLHSTCPPPLTLTTAGAQALMLPPTVATSQPVTAVALPSTPNNNTVVSPIIDGSTFNDATANAAQSKTAEPVNSSAATTPAAAAATTAAIAMPRLHTTRAVGVLRSDGGVSLEAAGPVSQLLISNSHRLADFFRSVMEDTLTDMASGSPANSAGSPEAQIRLLQLENERLRSAHAQEIAQLRAQTDRIVAEMQKTMESERQRITNELRRQSETDRVRAVEDAKRRQWCVQCGREAQFFCCWNTSYCDHLCQQQHWLRHMPHCAQASAMVEASDPRQPQQLQHHQQHHQQQQQQQQQQNGSANVADKKMQHTLNQLAREFKLTPVPNAGKQQQQQQPKHAGAGQAGGRASHAVQQRNSSGGVSGNTALGHHRMVMADHPLLIKINNTPQPSLANNHSNQSRQVYPLSNGPPASHFSLLNNRQVNCVMVSIATPPAVSTATTSTIATPNIAQTANSSMQSNANMHHNHSKKNSTNMMSNAMGSTVSINKYNTNMMMSTTASSSAPAVTGSNNTNVVRLVTQPQQHQSPQQPNA